MSWTATVRTCALTALLAGLAACASSKHTSGRPIDQAKVDRIVKGKTTMEEIIEWFGAPTSSTDMGGNMLYTYAYTIRKGSAFAVGPYASQSGDEQSDELTITFEKSTSRVKTFSLQRGIGQK